MHRQSDLIRNTLLTLSFRHRKEELEKQYPSVLALLCYSPVGMEEGFQCIGNLRKEKVRLRLWIDEPLTSFYSIEDIVRKTGSDEVYVHPRAACQPPTPYPHLFLPVLSYSLVSKVIHHDDSHPFSKIILESLFTGCKVGAISMAADPYHPLWKEKGYHQATPFMKYEMKSRLLQLRGYGVELFEPHQLAAWLRKGKQLSKGKRIVSQEVILQAYASQKFIIEIDTHTIITPLAQDLAKQLGMEFRLGGR